MITEQRRVPVATSQTTTPEHHPALVHHFDDMEQQKEASTFGMWVFLLTEIMMFGGLFTAYLIYRRKFYLAFVAGLNTNHTSLGFANTTGLTASSFTITTAVGGAPKKLFLAPELFPPLPTPFCAAPPARDD